MCEVIEKYLTFLVSKIREGAIKSGEFSNNEIKSFPILCTIDTSES